ncbi:MAG: NYN domain-containing protein [Bacteroidia bacterium]|nr:NYN domain-containing protein [Bacteroidia bacterium]
MEGQNVAIYLDFENLAISAETVYPSKPKPLLIEPLVDYATTKGAVLIKKAYADWSKDIFSQYQNTLMEQGFELIHLPGTNLQGKNGSDVRLAVDVMEYMELFPRINSILIGSGDTDFIPLIQRLRARGKEVIIVGFEHSVGKLVKRNSDEFKSLEELLGKPEAESPISGLTDDLDVVYGRDLMLRFLRSRNEDEPVLMSRLKQQLLRLDPSFSEKELGFSTFKQFIESLVGDLVEKIEAEDQSLPLIYFSEVPEEEITREINNKENALQFLNKKLRYQKAAPKRIEISGVLLKGLKEDRPMSMNQMFEYVSENLDRKIPKTDIKKYINTLFTGGAFRPIEQKANGPLLARPFFLKESLRNPELLDEIYIQRVSEILQSRYTELGAQEILEMLI